MTNIAEWRLGEYQRLVEVGSIKPLTGDEIDVWTSMDEEHTHALISPKRYKELEAIGMIIPDEKTGYPCYIGLEPLR